ncbi:alpha/beta hydrolase [Mitsuokella jalaludinii]|uniref:alpha/beta hydrolase n=4 Tax=Mitsuokella jalaludinii TaxID=187979 RepID=UPI003079059C
MQKKKYMKRMLVMATLSVTMALGTVGMTAEAAAQTDKAQTNVQTQQAAADTKVQGESNLKLPTEWDKVFPESRDVNHRKVTFHNRYGIELAADLYEPKKITGKLAAVAVSGPFGAVKEQSSGLYAQELAKRGFLTIAFDPSFTGESGGVNGVRNVASPDINTEDFSAAVDFLSNEKDVDPDRIGILGICGWGGMALNAAAMDTRIKATVVSTMYDMSRVMANGYFDYDKDAETIKKERMANRRALNAQRTEDYRTGTYKRAGGVVDPLPADAPQFVKDYYAYYKTKRGYHPRSLNSNEGWNLTTALSFMNMPLLTYADEIESAVLVIHGEKAHSRYFGEDAFKKLKGDNKELMIIPSANHTDLYDNMEKIPFDKITSFFQKYLK